MSPHTLLPTTHQRSRSSQAHLEVHVVCFETTAIRAFQRKEKHASSRGACHSVRLRDIETNLNKIVGSP
ncbi:hypothetical protein ACTXT7_017524 [Hymenolepis weldensis]